MSTPAPACLLMASATAPRIVASNFPASIASPRSCANKRSTTSCGLGRLPTWVVRMRSVLFIFLCFSLYVSLVTTGTRIPNSHPLAVPIGEKRLGGQLFQQRGFLIFPLLQPAIFQLFEQTDPSFGFAVLFPLLGQFASALQQTLRQSFGIAPQPQAAGSQGSEIVAPQVGHAAQGGNQFRSFGAHFGQQRLQVELFLHQRLQLGLFAAEFDSTPAKNFFERELKTRHELLAIPAPCPAWTAVPACRAACRSFAHPASGSR